jgi:hypothetical protein
MIKCLHVVSLPSNPNPTKPTTFLVSNIQMLLFCHFVGHRYDFHSSGLVQNLPLSAPSSPNDKAL